MATAPLIELRRICLAFPEASERLSHGEPTWFVRKRVFAMFADNHHGDGIVGIWLPAFPGAQEELIERDPATFFRPPFVGHRGYIGVRLDREPDWQMVTDLVEDAYRLIAPKTLVAALDG